MAKKAQYSVVDSKESFEALLTRVRQAQQEFARYSQERVDAIFKAAGHGGQPGPHPSGQGGCGGRPAWGS